MKDYSLLTFKNSELFRNWTATYLTELNSKTLSLFNYTNYFIPDFLKNDSITDYSDLQYHQWHRVTDAEVAALGSDHLLGAKGGFAIISYARGENEYDTNNSVIRKDSSFYSVVPAAWCGFYDIYIGDSRIYFEYDQYAEEKYGREDLIYNMDMFTSRFFTTFTYNGTGNLAEITGLDGMSLYARKLQDQDNEIVIDRQSHYWMNIRTNPVMGFTYYHNEEIVLDTNITYSRVALTNIARYTITRNNLDIAIAPEDTCIALV